MNAMLKTASIAAWCFLGIMHPLAYAGDETASSPSVQVIWKPATGLDAIYASITNKSSYPIKLDPTINVTYGETLSYIPNLAGDKDVFKVFIILFPTPPAGWSREGVYPFPILIEPGVTKDMGFLINPADLTPAKNATSAKLILECNEVIYGQTTLDNIHDALNATQQKLLPESHLDTPVLAPPAPR